MQLKLSVVGFLLLLLAPISRAQAQPAPKTNQLGMTCGRVLALSSSDYIAKYVAIDDSNMDGQLRGIGRYGACYDARTDALAASLARSSKGPTKAARADFASFEAAIKNFTTMACADVPGRPTSPKEAYANLYEKQFRYEFYEEYEAKATKSLKPAAPATRSSSSAPATSTAAGTPAPPGGSKSTPPAPATAEERARSDADPVTRAKNRFGKILDALPDDQMHELHKAFGEVIGPHAMSETTRLAVYRSAIFLLEPPSATPFAPPPF